MAAASTQVAQATQPRLFAESSLRVIDDAAVKVVDFKPLSLDHTRSVHGESFPLALTLADESQAATLDQIKDYIQQLAEKGVIRKLLTKRA
jgi:phosphate starvation-inducible protein PhoH